MKALTRQTFGDYRSANDGATVSEHVHVIAQPEQWPKPDVTIIRPERPVAPKMSERDFNTVFGPWASWISDAAEVKSAPVDFVALALLSVASAAVGNSR